MFKELAPLVQKSMLCIFISAEGDQLRVNILPKAVEGLNPALFTPLSVVASPDELDAKMPEILAGYANAHQSLEDSLENVKLVMEEAKRAAMDKSNAKPATGKKAGVASSVLEHANGNDELGDDVPFGDAPVTATPVVASKKNDHAELDLFK